MATYLIDQTPTVYWNFAHVLIAHLRNRTSNAGEYRQLHRTSKKLPGDSPGGLRSILGDAIVD